MRVGEMPTPEQSIAIVGTELHVRKELLVQDAPRVEVLEGVSMTANYEVPVDGGRTEIHSHAYSGMAWRAHFNPGEKLTSIDVGTQRVTSQWGGPGMDYYCGGEITKRTLQPDELLIVQKQHYTGQWVPDETVLLPATKPFPGKDGEAGYELLGIIKSDGGLLGFGSDGQYAQELVSYSLAMQYADTPADAFVVDEAWGRASSLVTRVQLHELTTAYLNYWKEQRDADFFPDKEPHELWTELTYPDPELIERLREPARIALAEELAA